MNKPKVRKTYLKILALLSCPFILSGCSNQSECTETSDHAHRYVNPKTGIELHIGNSEYLTYNGYIWQEDFYTLNEDDVAFYEQKKDLFYGPDNWDYLYNVMASKKDRIEYRYRYDDGFDYAYRWIESNQENKHYTGDVCVYHYRFCGHRIILKDGKWIDERSPFVDDIRDIIDEYPYFQLDPYMVVHKDYIVKPEDIPKTWLADVSDFKGPDLENKELHPNTK